MSAAAGPSFTRAHRPYLRLTLWEDDSDISLPKLNNLHFRLYVKSLYKRILINELNWHVTRSLWRQKAIEVRTQFERNRHVTDPRALAALFETAEDQLAKHLHPDPYRPPTAPGGTKWERNTPPPPFTKAEAEAVYADMRKNISPNVMRPWDMPEVPDGTYQTVPLSEEEIQREARRKELLEQ